MAKFTVITSPVTIPSLGSVVASYAGVSKAATLAVNPPPAADTVAIQQAEYRVSRQQLKVQATSTSANAALRVYVTSTGALIGTLNNTGGGKYRGQFNWPSNPANITVRSSLGGSASRSVAVR
jgi:hypothetical protein